MRDIHWDLFQNDWTLNKLKQAILDQTMDKAVYIGATASPSWRHSLCKNHDNMRAHSEHYEAMFVLTVDVAACVEVLEERLIELCKEVAASKVLNDSTCHRDSLPEHGHLFLYP